METHVKQVFDKVVLLIEENEFLKKFYNEYLVKKEVKYEFGKVAREFQIGVYTIRYEINQDQGEEIIGMKQLLSNLNTSECETFLGHDISFGSYAVRLITDDSCTELIGTIYFVNGKILTKRL